MSTLDVCVRARKDRYPAGFASADAHRRHRDKVIGLIIEEAIADTEATVAGYDELIAAETQATSSR